MPGGIKQLDNLWDALAHGRDLVTEIPPDRFDIGRFVDTDRARSGRSGKSYTPAGGFLEDIAGFDTSFFSHISPREAEWLDPQQRLMLELAVEAIDDAGLAAGELAGTDASVYVGVSSRDYLDLQNRRPRGTGPYAVSGSAAGNTANRVSHLLDLHGPSVAVDTACSSALTAVHEACEQLRSGRSRLALAGGVNVLLSPYAYAGCSAASMLSPTGRCRTFSERADGYVRAEGGGMVVLKPLADALAAGDRVYAVVLGSGTNSDGASSALAVPDQKAQQDLLRQVYTRAGIAPDQLAYLEAHGTGTRVGDPVECRSIGTALGSVRTGGPLLIGSVKTNLGHLEAAAGMPGLLKAILVLRKRAVPPTLNAEPLNPDIDFAGLGLSPTLKLTPLTSPPQAVGVNSFGFGGSNAHVILGPAPEPSTPPAPPRRDTPVLVSAATRQALSQVAARLADRLDEAGAPTAPSDPDVVQAAGAADFYDVAYTATMRRGHHTNRAAVLASEPGDAARALRALAAGEEVPGAASAEQVRHGSIAFVFSGNGSQWAGMGTDLLSAAPVFRDAVDAVDAELIPHLGWSVRDALAAPPDAWRLAATEVAQPLLFAVQVGLVKLLESYGVQPDAVIGHSVGETAAAWAAGALTMTDAAAVVAARSRAQGSTAGAGRMAAVGLSASAAREELEVFGGALEIAGVNGPQDVTVAGDADALVKLGKQVTARGVFFRPLDLNYAFHSWAMDPLADTLRAALAGVRPGAARLPFASTVTGTLVEGGALDAEYWWRNVRRPVLFADAVGALRAAECDVFVEIGPHPVLAGYLRKLAANGDPMAVVPTCRRDGAGGGGTAEVRTAVAQCAAAGAQIDWEGYFPHAGRVVALPSYPWQRERVWRGQPHWWDAASDAGAAGSTQHETNTTHPLLGARLTDLEPVWSGLLEISRTPWLADHKVGAAVVFPAAGYVETALAAGHRLFDGPTELHYLDIARALVLPADDAGHGEVWLQTSYSEDDQVVRIAARGGEHEPWRTHVRGRLRRLLAPTPPLLDVDAIRSRCARTVFGAEHYARLSRIGLPYGRAFQVLRSLHEGDSEVLATYHTELPGDGFQVHPTILDGALQAGATLLAALGDAAPFLPVAVERVRLWSTPPPDGMVHVVGRELGVHEVCWDVTVTGPGGQVAVELTGCRLRRYAGDGPESIPLRRLAPVLRACGGPEPDAAPGPDLRPSALRAASAGRVTPSPSEGAAADGFAAALAEFSAHFAAQALAELAPRGAAFTVPDLLTAGMQPQFANLVGHLLRLVARHGLAEPGPDSTWRLTGTPCPQERLRATAERHPGQVMSAALYARCGLHLPDVLRGRTDALELLFADADQHLLEHFYANYPGLRATHRRCAALLRALVDRWPADRPLRVLEIGAGTGATTSTLLPLLPRERTEYVFTDISPAFFSRAQARFAGYDFIRYQALNLDTDPAGQGFEPAAFDVVIGTNVLHATADLRKTLTRVHDLLADGGLLLAVEVHNTPLMAPCFGLLDSFWSHTDTTLRPDSPLLSVDEWMALLAECGFEDPVRVSDDADEEDRSAAGDQSVLLTRRPARATDLPPMLPAGVADHWLIAAERPAEELPRALAAHLEQASGTEVSVIGTDEVMDGQWPARVPPTAGAPHLVLLLGDDPSARPTDALDQAIQRMTVLRSLAADCRALSATTAPTLTLVTRPSGALPAPETPDAPGDAVLWGGLRTLTNEEPRATVRRIALRPEPGHAPAADARRLARQLLQADAEDEVLLTPGGRFAARLMEYSPDDLLDRTAARLGDGHGSPGETVSHTLRVDAPGTHHRLRWETAPAAAPGPGEVAIEVHAAALNYRDVMMAVGIYPPGGEAIPSDGVALGLECAGRITAVGDDVRHLEPGQRVYAVGRRCLATHVVARADQTAPIPDGMTYAQATTLPVVCYTVHQSLARLARLGPGETLLLHGAAGGVGLAALQYAQACGAHVIATAGTPAKRELLRLFGADHVLDSRGLEFADQVAELTGGKGVDVVLNSLAGEAIPRSLELLRPGGRFIEIGKRDIYAATPLLLRPFRNNVSYFAVDAHQLLTQDVPGAAAVFAETAAAIDSGGYRPLPHQTYPAERVDEAFQAMRRSRHIGKVVISFDTPPPAEQRTQPTPRHAGANGHEGTVLITGGLSGFGAATAVHLARHGVRHLALAGRRGAGTPGATALLEELATFGAEAVAYQTDVTDPDQISALLRDIEATGHPLRGVVHASMVLDDGPLPELTEPRLRAVLAPKLLGGLLLDHATRGRGLDFFVVYSSAAGVVGNVLQASYAGANLFLEALVRQRRQAGDSGLALAFGPISDAGYVAREGLVDALRQIGWLPITAAEAFVAFDELLSSGAAMALVDRSDWGTARWMLPAVSAPRFTAVLPSDDPGESHASPESLRLRLRDAAPEQAHATICDALADVLSAVLHHPKESLDPSRPMDQLGVDSLMATELSLAVRRRFGCEFSGMEITQIGSIDSLAHRIIQRLGHSAAAHDHQPNV